MRKDVGPAGEAANSNSSAVAQRLIVYLLAGGVAGFGAVFLQLPGIVLALVLLGIIAGTGRGRFNLVRVGGYLMGAGLVGWSLVGPSVKGAGGFLFLSAWVLVTAYGIVAVAGALLVAALAVIELRRSRLGRPVNSGGAR